MEDDPDEANGDSGTECRLVDTLRGVRWKLDLVRGVIFTGAACSTVGVGLGLEVHGCESDSFLAAPSKANLRLCVPPVPADRVTTKAVATYSVSSLWHTLVHRKIIPNVDQREWSMILRLASETIIGRGYTQIDEFVSVFSYGRVQVVGTESRR
jgi:hypothetical protein